MLVQPVAVSFACSVSSMSEVYSRFAVKMNIPLGIVFVDSGCAGSEVRSVTERASCATCNMRDFKKSGSRGEGIFG